MTDADYWNIKVFSDGEERETLRGLSELRAATLMRIFDREGVHAQAKPYSNEDGFLHDVDLYEAPNLSKPDEARNAGDGGDEEIEPDKRFYDIEDRFRMGEEKVSAPTVRTILCWDCGTPIRNLRKPEVELETNPDNGGEEDTQ